MTSIVDRRPGGDPRRGARALRARVRAARRAWDQEGEVPHDAVAQLAEQGFLGMAIPEEWGGVGYDARTIAVVVEEIAYVSAALAIMIAVHNSVGALPVFRYGTEEQSRSFLPRLVSQGDGRVLALGARRGIGRRLPRGDRDARRRPLRARTGEELGHERRCAGIYLVFARTDREAGNRVHLAHSSWRGDSGLTLGKPEDKMGSGVRHDLALAREPPRSGDERLGAEELRTCGTGRS